MKVRKGKFKSPWFKNDYPKHRTNKANKIKNTKKTLTNQYKYFSRAELPGVSTNTHTGPFMFTNAEKSSLERKPLKVTKQQGDKYENELKARKWKDSSQGSLQENGE